MEGDKPRTWEDRIQELKYGSVVEPPPDTGWPTWEKVSEEYPDLCAEEQQWILEALITSAHKERANRNVGPTTN